MSYESPTKSSSVDKPVKTEEKSASSGSSGGAYAELTGEIVGKAEDAFDGPVTVTIQLTGGPSSGDLVLTFPNKEAATKIPDMLDDKGQHVPPIPVKIEIMPGPGAPSPDAVAAKAKEQAKKQAKEQTKEQAEEAPPPGHQSTY